MESILPGALVRVLRDVSFCWGLYTSRHCEGFARGNLLDPTKIAAVAITPSQ